MFGLLTLGLCALQLLVVDLKLALCLLAAFNRGLVQLGEGHEPLTDVLQEEVSITEGIVQVLRLLKLIKLLRCDYLRLRLVCWLFKIRRYCSVL